MAGDETSQIHATCVALGGKGALLCGEPGAGKSDLALRFLSMFVGDCAALVADDQTVLSREGGRLYAHAPKATAGLIEVRGIGIVEVAHLARTELVLVAELATGEEIERLPDPAPRTTLLGVEVPLVRLAAFEASAPVKLKIALTGKP